MAHSKGTWSVGKGCTVITNDPEGFEAITGHCGPENEEYYGGKALIAESVWKEDDRKLIAAAPDLLDACMQFWNAEIDDEDDGIEKVNARDSIAKAIKKATGEWPHHYIPATNDNT